jgi:hypothetical protein
MPATRTLIRPRKRRGHTPRFLVDLDRRVLPPIVRAFGRLSRNARRGRVLIVIGVVASVVAALLAVYTATRTPVPLAKPGVTITIGVAKGQSIPAYVHRSERTLQGMVADPKHPSSVFALVAFNDYLRPAQLTSTLAGVQVLTVFMRVPSTNNSAVHVEGEPRSRIVAAQASLIPGDVITRMRAEANEKRLNYLDYQRLVGIEKGSSAAIQRLRATYQQDALLADREMKSYQSLCGCVFAALVNGTPTNLAVLASRDTVRVVDTHPELRSGDFPNCMPPLPEQTGLADPPQGSPDAFP